MSGHRLSGAGSRWVAAWVMVSMLSAYRARAEAPPVDAGVPAPATDGGTASPDAGQPDAGPAPKAKDSLDFDLFAEQPKTGKQAAPAAPGTNLKAPPTAEQQAQLAHAVKTRRLMLQLHQGFGFATLGMLAITLVIGQLNYVDKFGGGNFTEKYQVPHEGLALTTTVLFATDASLSLFAPTPYKKPLKADAALLHKVMMTVAAAGMVTQVALGFVSASKSGELIQRDLALTHMVVGYATFASMLTGYLAYVF